MAFGVARAAVAASAGAAGLLSVLIARPAVAQDSPPALSASCEAPAADIASPEPLPHVAAALLKRSSLRVLAIGSSSTGPAAMTAGSSYPARVEEILERSFRGLDVRVVNRGTSGEVAAVTAERLKAQVALEQPQLVLWQVGTNDALARVPPDAFVPIVRDTVRWLRQHGIDVVLVGLQYAPRAIREQYYSGIRPALTQLAAAEDVLLVRRADAMEFIERSQQARARAEGGQGVEQLGPRCLAEHVVRAVVVSAFLRGKPVTSPP